MRAIIVDDESHLRHHLEKLLGDASSEIEVAGKAADGEAALALVKQIQPELIFLDIRMPGISGLEVAKRLNRETSPPYIIFTTAYDEYAVEAFEQAAVDYLLKPINESRLHAACQRVLARARQAQPPTDLSAILESLSKTEKSYTKWIKASSGDELFVIAADDVEAFVAEDKYTSVTTPERSYVIRTPLKELKQQLDPDQFWPIHRSCIIRVEAVSKVKKDFVGRLTVQMKSGQTYPVSRNAAALFKSM